MSKPFSEHAARVIETLPRSPERTVALRKLLEAKDAAVRALLGKEYEWDDFAKKWVLPSAKGPAITHSPAGA